MLKFNVYQELYREPKLKMKVIDIMMVFGTLYYITHVIYDNHYHI